MSKPTLVPKTYHPHKIGAYKKTSKSKVEAFSMDISVDMTAMRLYNTTSVRRVTSLYVEKNSEGVECFFANKSQDGGKPLVKPQPTSELFWWSIEQHPRADQKPA